MRFENNEHLHDTLRGAFKEAELMCRWFQDNIKCFVPPGLMLPRVTHFDLDEPLEKQTTQNV